MKIKSNFELIIKWSTRVFKLTIFRWDTIIYVVEGLTDVKPWPTENRIPANYVLWACII